MAEVSSGSCIPLSDAASVVLDEATSAPDNTTEARDIQNLRAHAAGRTVVMVAHRSVDHTAMGRSSGWDGAWGISTIRTFCAACKAAESLQEFDDCFCIKA